MYKNKRLLAVVPARGGSKGIPLKNISPLAGKQLLVYTSQTIAQLPDLDRAVLSSDHPEIISVAKRYGLDAPFVRPLELSGDVVADWDVLVHALKTMENLDGCEYDVVVMLQPTCPLRKPEHVMQTVKMLVDNDYDAVWTVSPTDSKAHPLKQLVVANGLIDFYDPQGKSIIARQQLQPVYHRNGAAYAISRKCLLMKESIKGDACGAVVVNDKLANIDTMEDIYFAEYLLENELL